MKVATHREPTPADITEVQRLCLEGKSLWQISIRLPHIRTHRLREIVNQFRKSKRKSVDPTPEELEERKAEIHAEWTRLNLWRLRWVGRLGHRDHESLQREASKLMDRR